MLTYHRVEAGGSTFHLYHIQRDFELILPIVPKSPSLKRKIIISAKQLFPTYVHLDTVYIHLKYFCLSIYQRLHMALSSPHQPVTHLHTKKTSSNEVFQNNYSWNITTVLQKMTYKPRTWLFDIHFFANHCNLPGWALKPGVCKIIFPQEKKKITSHRIF